MPTRNLNIKGNSFNSEMPFPQSETHILLLLKIKRQYCIYSHNQCIQKFPRFYEACRRWDEAVKSLF